MRPRPSRVRAAAIAASLALLFAPVVPSGAAAQGADTDAAASVGDARGTPSVPPPPPGGETLQESDGLTVERIFRSDDFVPETFEGTWRSEEAWTLVEKDDRDRDELWQVDAATGEREKLISASELVPEDGDEPISIYDWSFSPDGRYVLIFTDAQRVWRDRTKGRYYTFDLADRKLRPVSRKPGWQMFAKFGPDSRRVAFVRDHDIHVTEIATGEERALTTSGTEDTINGTTDWVYEEELGLRDAFRWSPDGERIAYWQLDQSPIPRFHLVDQTTLYPELKDVRYPKAGTENSEVRVGSLELETGETTWMDVGSPEYIVRMEWVSDREAAVQTLNRHQDRLEVRIADARTGKSRRVLAETDDAWVDVDGSYAWIDGGERLVWSSDRDGHDHLYLFDRSGERVRQLTRGEWPVTGFYGVDEERGRVWFQAAAQSPMTRSVGWVPLGGGEPRWVAGPAAGRPCVAGGSGEGAGSTAGGGASGPGYADASTGSAGDGPGGVHSARPAPGFGRLVHTCSTFDTPPVVRLRTAGGDAVRTLVDNAELRARLDSLDLGSHAFVTVDAADGETELNGWMMRPPDFDPTREHPLLMYVYGGPGIQTVMDAWGGARHLWHRVMASKGFLVASVDNRGTGARGRDFYKQVHLRLGQLETADQLAAARQLGERPEVDADRVGIWGWSYGGYMTLMSLLQSEGVLSAGISVAPVTHWKLYDTIYTERYMRTPSENPEGYRKGAPLEHAAKLDADLFLVHGTGDDNVHPQHTVRMVQALEEANKQFRMRIYPNERHGIEDAADRVNLFEGMTGFLQETLGGG